eukprot:m.230461 g.230461  ORF g.230461 m.230461 type:complete len:634 (-) comp12068_c0_seq1:102-2003(-)
MASGLLAIQSYESDSEDQDTPAPPAATRPPTVPPRAPTQRTPSDSQSSQLPKRPRMSKPTLQDVLEGTDIEAIGAQLSSSVLSLEVPEGACVECENVQATVKCEQCKDIYCPVCFAALHRKGKRIHHVSIPVEPPTIAAGSKTVSANHPGHAVARPLKLATEKDAADYERFSPEWFVERAKYIPVRLDLKERKRLRLMIASLGASDYTDRVDQAAASKGKRLHLQLQNICAVLSSVLVAMDLPSSDIEEHNFHKHGMALMRLFEYARRHKIMNPEKLRGDYGKLVYLLQDTVDPAIQELLQCPCVMEIQSVYKFLVKRGAEALLEDPQMQIATREIMPEGKERYAIQQEIKTKERAIEKLSRDYSNQDITRDEIKWCLYSITDNHSFLRSNRVPIDDMIVLLQKYFKADSFEEGYNLAITSGVDGSRLTHDHGRHFNFILQSLSLWREITDDMFRLWWLAEQDIIDPASRYELKNTGQGLHRVQAAPRVGAAMRRILHRVQSDTWVGSRVVHLGDNNVPNALMFIDKYTQVSRILTPIVHAVRYVDKMMTSPKLSAYVTETFGGAGKLQKDILYDFFRYGFDGSGADNFFDAGSCIDGRLTSAWNWCSRLEQKPFFPVFKLSGFIGFDGDFQQ